VAAAWAAIAELLEGQGKDAEAEPMYRRALTVLEHWFGADHHDVATMSDHLARIRRHALEERVPKNAARDACCV
jgi:hypothetical protein